MNHISDGFNRKSEPRNCPKHGDFTDTGIILMSRVVWAGCPACMAERQAIKDAEDAKRREEEQQAAWMRKLQISGIPERFHDRRISGFKAETPAMQNAKSIALEYAQSWPDPMATGQSLLFCGKPGTGKTHLASAIGMGAMKAGGSVAFTTAMAAVRAIRETWRKDSERSENEVIDAFTKPSLLIIDEVGQQYGSDGEKVILFDIINARYEKRRPMIVMSNLDLAGLSEFLGERAFDRLREGGGKAVAFEWPSYRGRAAA